MIDFLTNSFCSFCYYKLKDMADKSFDIKLSAVVQENMRKWCLVWDYCELNKYIDTHTADVCVCVSE